MTAGEVTKYNQLMLPVLLAVENLGGSGSSREITAEVIAGIGYSEAQVAETYPNRPKSVVIDRIEWARSYCKMGGLLDSPQRSLYLITTLGREIAALSATTASERLREIDRQVRASRRARKPDTVSDAASDDAPPEDDEADEQRLEEAILERLHQLSPTAFEEFCLYLLRRYGMELTRVGGSGDEGIDGIGTAPLERCCLQRWRFKPSDGTPQHEWVAKPSPCSNEMPLLLAPNEPSSSPWAGSPSRPARPPLGQRQRSS